MALRHFLLDERKESIDRVPVDKSEENDEKIILSGMLKDLPPREKKIIILRYFRDRTQSEVAAVLGVSQVQISRLENKIIAKLRENFDK